MKNPDPVAVIKSAATEIENQRSIIENLKFHNRGLSAALNDYHTTKHNRDVELTDLLAELAERYRDVMRPYDLERIEKLTGDRL